MSGLYWQPLALLLCVSTGKVGSEMFQGTGLEGWGVKRQQLGRGEHLGARSEEGSISSGGTANELALSQAEPLLLSGQTSGPEVRDPVPPASPPGGATRAREEDPVEGSDHLLFWKLISRGGSLLPEALSSRGPPVVPASGPAASGQYGADLCPRGPVRWP